MTRSRNSWLEQVHRANLQKIASYPVAFPRDLFFFSFFCSLPCFFFSFSFSLLKLKIYILVHIWLCGRLSDKKIWFPKTRLVFFFWPYQIFFLFILYLATKELRIIPICVQQTGHPTVLLWFIFAIVLQGVFEPQHSLPTLPSSVLQIQFPNSLFPGCITTAITFQHH